MWWTILILDLMLMALELLSSHFGSRAQQLSLLATSSLRTLDAPMLTPDLALLPPPLQLYSTSRLRATHEALPRMDQIRRGIEDRHPLLDPRRGSLHELRG